MPRKTVVNWALVEELKKLEQPQPGVKRASQPILPQREMGVFPLCCNGRERNRSERVHGIHDESCPWLEAYIDQEICPITSQS